MRNVGQTEEAWTGKEEDRDEGIVGHAQQHKPLAGPGQNAITGFISGFLNRICSLTVLSGAAHTSHLEKPYLARGGKLESQ